MRTDEKFRQHEGDDYPAEVMTFGEKLVTKFIYLVMLCAVVLLFFVSFSRSAHAGEFVKSEEVPRGPVYLHRVVGCDTLEQTLAQIAEIYKAEAEARGLRQVDGCGMLVGGIPAMVYEIGTIITNDREVTIVRFETIGEYGDQYGWSATTKKISSI